MSSFSLLELGVCRLICLFDVTKGLELNAEQSEVLIRSFKAKRSSKTEDSEEDITLGWTEFKEVMEYFLQLKNAFDTHDRDNNRLINKCVITLTILTFRLELRTLLNSFNWNFVETTRNKLMTFFDKDKSGSIDFDEYFTMMLHLREVFTRFQSKKVATFEAPEIHALLR